MTVAYDAHASDSAEISGSSGVCLALFMAFIVGGLPCIFLAPLWTLKQQRRRLKNNMS